MEFVCRGVTLTLLKGLDERRKVVLARIVYVIGSQSYVHHLSNVLKDSKLVNLSAHFVLI